MNDWAPEDIKQEMMKSCQDSGLGYKLMEVEGVNVYIKMNGLRMEEIMT